MSKWPRMSHLDICNTSYGKKKGWLPTTKSQESTRPRCVKMECDTPLESSQLGLQVCFIPHPNPRSEQKVMNSQNPGSPNRNSFGTPPWSLGVPRQIAIRMWVPRSNAKNTIWGKVVASPESGPWWVLWVRSCPWLVLAPMDAPEYELINLLVGLM